MYWLFPGDADLREILERFTKKVSNKDGICLWQCLSCNKMLKKKCHLIEHIEQAHIPGLQFKCPYCSYWLSTRCAIRSHVNQNHKNDHVLYQMGMANLEWVIEEKQ